MSHTAHHTGPTYHEWLALINHNRRDFSVLKQIGQRIANSKDFSRLSQAQRVRLLTKLGDLQITAAHHN